MIVAFKGVKYAITTDAWTSVSKTGYVTCTCHFIDPATWKRHSMVLGLYEKTGRSRAIDCVEYAEMQMRAFHLPYSNLSCVVTDTEATMVAASRLVLLLMTHLTLLVLCLPVEPLLIFLILHCRL
jgi:hypothetical protein